MSYSVPQQPTSSEASDPAPKLARVWGAALVLMLFAAAMWFAWLGWDHEYYKVNGVWQGPYRAWQVIGCGLAVGAGSVFAYLRVPRAVAIFLLASAADIGFAVPWAWDASSDETGMWVVGLFLLLVGGGIGLLFLLSVTAIVHSTWKQSPSR